ncbi:antibiotic biosynthesis monooxygenase [Catellatospora chokoriensis]|uniref:antibiotic biosynthesis monooxygenase n=1 Tax=Catellatospora chokoriensis TaxID=310353 RepID=UPI00194062C2|nr:antibiotic biosynthesis monooxygenase [Catellatospora chokoriensis]
MESRVDPATGGPAASATVVITQHVTAGREDEYQPWQQRTIEAAGRFDGFENAEMCPPDTGGERVVVFRFTTVEQLTAWMQSDVRRRLLDEGAGLFDAPPAVEVLVGEPPARDVVTAVVSHDVLPGREQAFARWQDRMSQAQERFPGYLGSELFPPVPGVQEHWVTLLRYDTAAHLTAWLESDARARLLHEAGRILRRPFDLHTIRSPFSGWFGFGGAPAAVPSWKQAMAVLLALFPTVTLLYYVGAPLLRALQVTGAFAIFVSNVLSSVILTWLLMPLVNRALAFWLLPHGPHRVRTDVAGAAVVVACYAVLIAVFTALFG